MRKPWIAVVLSLLCTGLGHAYCGRLRRGLVIFSLSLTAVPCAVLAAVAGPSTPLLVLLVIGALLGPTVYFFAVFDSARIARETDPDFVPRPYNRPAAYVLLFVFILPLSGGTMFLVKRHVLEAFKIPAVSMAPTIVPRDRILVNKLTYRFRDPERFDIVVFRYPEDKKVNYIKRLIALPGERVEVKDDRVIIDGRSLEIEEGEAPPPELIDGEVHQERDGNGRHLILLPRRGSSRDYPETLVPEGSYFVLGDARNNSKDSRVFGFVPREDLLGVAEYRFWPFGRFGAISGR